MYIDKALFWAIRVWNLSIGLSLRAPTLRIFVGAPILRQFGKNIHWGSYIKGLTIGFSTRTPM